MPSPRPATDEDELDFAAVYYSRRRRKKFRFNWRPKLSPAMRSYLPRAVLVLLGAQFSLLLATLIVSQTPFPHRLLHVALLLSYLATISAALVIAIGKLAPLKVCTSTFAVAASFFLIETMLELFVHVPHNALMQTLPGFLGNALQYNPQLGPHYKPYAEAKSYYADNPRGYFEKEEGKRRHWSLQLQNGNLAKLVFPPEAPEKLRLAIEKAEPDVPYAIQLNLPGLAVKAKEYYTLEFLARADRPRRLDAIVSKAHAPWDGLGLYERLELTSSWQNFELEFVATADDDNARIQFNAGGSGISVELMNVTLRWQPAGQYNKLATPTLSQFGIDKIKLSPGEEVKVASDASKTFSISYRFNALGGRGREYAIPPPDSTVRLLVLGDSYTLGIGVREEDTFASQLERLLNERAKRSGSPQHYEVINAGVSGYGTRDERQFYQNSASKYKPDLVLLVMIWNDDQNYLDDSERAFVPWSGKPESLFYAWAEIRQYRHRQAAPNFSGSLYELLQLEKEVRQQGARLAVVFFNNVAPTHSTAPRFVQERWSRLVSAVARGVKQAKANIPMLDIRKALFPKYSEEDLAVHATSDGHPNEIAHAIAAREIMSFLMRKNLLE
jgi:lysophospholipase L1-like esterase